jgi:hypothetical protein
MSEKSIWGSLMEGLNRPQEAQAKPDAFKDPKIMDAQRRATENYFRTGQNRPLDDFLNDPALK